MATVLTAFSMNPTWDLACRFITGAGIGGEHAAINSAIDELTPNKYRGRVDIAINGSFWIGAAAGAVLTIPLLDPTVIEQGVGWRLASTSERCWRSASSGSVGPFPRAPSLAVHPRTRDEAETVVSRIEATVVREAHDDVPKVDDGSIRIRQRRSVGMGEIARVVITRIRDGPRSASCSSSVGPSPGAALN